MEGKNKKFIIFKFLAISIVCAILAGAMHLENSKNGFYADDSFACANTGKTEQSSTDFLILVNQSNPIPEDFVPDNLINLSEIVPATKSVIYFNEQASEDYYNMLLEMREHGLSDLYAISGYRTYRQQEVLFNNRVNSLDMEYEKAWAEAARVIAPPGNSEHQTGLALDVSIRSINFALIQRFARTPEYQWLVENSHRYGFIIRYPENKTHITGIIFEPWHLRYVGPDHALKIYESGLTLEEYIYTLDKKGAFS